MPRSAAATQVPAPAAIPHHLIECPDGEVFWATQKDNVEEPLTRLKREEIVLILKQSPSIGGYLVYSLEEPRSDEAGDGKVPPFKLSVLPAAYLPEKPLAGLLLDDIPTHLQSDGRRRLLDVIVSTRSGLGLASAFYRGVLHSLLGALGLEEDGLGSSGHAEEALQNGDRDGSRGYGFRYKVTVTKSSQTIRDFARGLGQSDPSGAPERTIVLLSGDGGVVDLLNGLDQSAGDVPPPMVTVLPLGTGNALFHSLHKPLYKAGSASAAAPSPLVLGLRTLFRGTAAPLPTFKASFSPGSYLVSSPEPAEVPVEGSNGDGNTNGKADGYGDDHPNGNTNGHTNGNSNGNSNGKINGNAKTDKEVEINGANNADKLNGEADSTCHPTEITQLIGAIVASYGFHASLVWESDTPAYRLHGDKRFGMAAASLLQISHPYHATVEIRSPNSLTFSPLPNAQFNYLLATMVSNLEKTFTISPDSRPLDGRLRLVHFGDVGGDRTMQIMMAAYRGGEHIGMRWVGDDGREDGVGYEEVEEVRVTIEEEEPRWRKVCIDGTIVEVPRGGWMSVGREERVRLRVLVGDGAGL